MIHEKKTRETVIRAACALVAVIALQSFAGYRAPATLRSDLSELLGPDRYALLVWQKNAGTSGIPNSYEGKAPNDIMIMDTKTGSPTVLVGSGDDAHKSDASFTWDGKRVVFFDNSNWDIRVIDIDGLNHRVIVNGYNGSGETWRSAGKDYVLATSMKGVGGEASSVGRELCRINIDDPDDIKVILTTTWNATQLEEGNAGTYWTSMSPDGKYLVGGFPTYSSIGSIELNANGTAVSAPNIFSNFNGCWPTMARDNSGDVLMTIGEHTEVMLCTWDGHEKEKWSSPIGMYECLRWTLDRDILTMIKCCGTGKPGPYIARWSDKQTVALSDDLETVEGNMDVFFYPSYGSAIKTIRASGVPEARFAGTQTHAVKFYDCRGNAAGNHGALSSGIYITAPAGVAGSRRAHVALPYGR